MPPLLLSIVYFSLSVSLSVSLCVFLSLCLFLCLSICLSVYFSVSASLPSLPPANGSSMDTGRNGNQTGISQDSQCCLPKWFAYLSSSFPISCHIFPLSRFISLSP